MTENIETKDRNVKLYRADWIFRLVKGNQILIGRDVLTPYLNIDWLRNDLYHVKVALRDFKNHSEINTEKRLAKNTLIIEAIIFRKYVSDSNLTEWAYQKLGETTRYFTDEQLDTFVENPMMLRPMLRVENNLKASPALKKAEEEEPVIYIGNPVPLPKDYIKMEDVKIIPAPVENKSTEAATRTKDVWDF